MKTYKVHDNRGQEIEIDEAQLYRHVKMLLAPVLAEMGMEACDIAKYDGDLYRLIGVMIAHIRERESALAVARKEFAKLRKQREEDYQVILRFLRSVQHVDTAESRDIVNLEDRKAA